MARYTVRSSSLHDLGLFAHSGSLQAGKKVFLEAPLLQMSASNDESTVPNSTEDLCDQLRKLERKDINRIRLLAIKNGDISNIPQEDFAQGLQNLKRDVHKAAMDVFSRRSIHLSTSSKDRKHAMFNEIDLVNHSCTPNAERYWNDLEGKMELRAIVEVKHGDEILVSYIHPHQARNKRHANLGFECKCSACSLHGSELSTFEQRIERLQKAFATLEEFESQYYPDRGFQKASDALNAAIATDPRIEDASNAAVDIIEIISKKFGSNSLQLSRSYRIINVILASRAEVQKDIVDFYKSSYDWSVLELQLLAACRGLRYQTARQMLRQLLDNAIERVAWGHVKVIRHLQNLLRSHNSSLKLLNVGQGGVQLEASIRDGPGDEEEKIASIIRGIGPGG